MKMILTSAILFVAATLAHQTVLAAPCAGCSSNSCTECTVKVGVFGYTAPTWRPWPATKFKSPTDREKVDRRLIRPDRFETPPARSEAEGVPRKADPVLVPPVVEPMPDLPPELPPELRNKQPIPIRTSSANKRERTVVSVPAKAGRAVTSLAEGGPPRRLRLAHSATPITETTHSRRANPPLRRTKAVERVAAVEETIENRAAEIQAATPRRIASLNIPTSARRVTSRTSGDNPLRDALGQSTGTNSPIAFKRAVTNMPFAVHTEPAADVTSNPLR